MAGSIKCEEDVSKVGGSGISSHSAHLSWGSICLLDSSYDLPKHPLLYASSNNCSWTDTAIWVQSFAYTLTVLLHFVHQSVLHALYMYALYYIYGL